MMQIGNCVRCGKSAAYNTPYLNPDMMLFCNSCVNADRSGVVFRAIRQHYDDDGDYVFIDEWSMNGVSVSDKYDVRSAYTDGGTRAVKLTEQEKKATPRTLLVCLVAMREAGYLRCTECDPPHDVKEENVAGYPLFAGTACKKGWKRHQEKVEEERKRGHVCRLCGKPYSNCYC